MNWLDVVVRLENLTVSLKDSKRLKIGLGMEVRQFGLEKISLKQRSNIVQKFFFSKISNKKRK